MSTRVDECSKPQWKGCCCNCANQLRVTKHPWNEVGKGSSSTTMGWVCTAGTDDGSPGTFFDRKHGFCEMHQERKT